jgi:5-methylcytosine-specific restriction endonuclease McrA
VSGKPQETIRFAEKLLALLEEGSFSSTYKFAVLLGLIDLCLEYADRHGDPPVVVTTTQLAHKVIELYWPQTSPFGAPPGLFLLQNAGRSPLIVSHIRKFRDEDAPDPGCSLHRARAEAASAFEKLVRDVEWTLVQMPLPKVQRFGGREDRFIYEIGWTDDINKGEWADSHSFDNRILLVGGAADHLMRLAPLLRPMIKQRWASMVGRLNDLEVTHLEDFLFGSRRVSPAAVRDDLRDMQAGRCFYCNGALRKEFAVDHFLPWSRHPDDRIDNLVIAHKSCNSQKRNFLAGSEHVRRWRRRLAESGGDLALLAERARWPRDTVRTLGAIQGVYLRLPDGVALWRTGCEFEPSNHDALVEALAE